MGDHLCCHEWSEGIIYVSHKWSTWVGTFVIYPDCHAKIGPPKIGLVRLILAEILPKISPAEPVLAAKGGLLLPILAPCKILICKNLAITS